MQRVVSVWFPHWPTDRLQRCLMRLSPEPFAQLVTARHDGRRRLVIAADRAALGLGVWPGMAVAQAIAIVPGLSVKEAEPEADASALEQLVRWCHRLTPLTAVDPPDGLWLDVTGCAHLWGGETALLQKLLARLARDGLQARAAIADTPGAAYALARYGLDAPMIVPSGTQEAAIAELPVAALRLPSALVSTLQRVGLDQVCHLSPIPRALLAHRFGPLPGLRLDQAHGRVAEPIKPLAPEHVLQRRAMFLEPLLTAESLAVATAQLVEPLCREMEGMGLGARQVDLLFERVDNQVLAMRIGTAQPSRDAHHLTRLLNEQLEAVDPGLGIEAMHLMIPVAQTLQWEQQEGGPSIQDVARLIDRLANRLGMARLYQATPLQSQVPDRLVEHSEPVVRAGQDLWADTHSKTIHVGRQPDQAQTPVRPKSHLTLVVSEAGSFEPARSLTKRPHLYLVETTTPVPDGQDPPLIAWKQSWEPAAVSGNPEPWPRRLHAPARLLNPPRQIEALMGLPDQLPSAFTWRRCRYRIRRVEGPERIHGEWWRHEHGPGSIRDYYKVEAQTGQRFWLFRQSNGENLSTRDLSWFLHGVF